MRIQRTGTKEQRQPASGWSMLAQIWEFIPTSIASTKNRVHVNLGQLYFLSFFLTAATISFSSSDSTMSCPFLTLVARYLLCTVGSNLGANGCSWYIHLAVEYVFTCFSLFILALCLKFSWAITAAILARNFFLLFLF